MLQSTGLRIPCATSHTFKDSCTFAVFYISKEIGQDSSAIAAGRLYESTRKTNEFKHETSEKFDRLTT